MAEIISADCMGVTCELQSIFSSMSNVKGPLITLILTITHVGAKRSRIGLGIYSNRNG